MGGRVKWGEGAVSRATCDVGGAADSDRVASVPASIFRVTKAKTVNVKGQPGKRTSRHRDAKRMRASVRVSQPTPACVRVNKRACQWTSVPASEQSCVNKRTCPVHKHASPQRAHYPTSVRRQAGVPGGRYQRPMTTRFASPLGLGEVLGL